VRRKYTWKPRPSQKGRTINFKGLHRHGCVECSETYEDACDTPQQNDRCTPHRSGNPAPLWELNLLPGVCCRESSARATSDEINTYRLAGEAEWWMCSKCKIPHIYDPASFDNGQLRPMHRKEKE